MWLRQKDMACMQYFWATELYAGIDLEREKTAQTPFHIASERLRFQLDKVKPA
jgi:hypothetical protein